MSFIFIFLINLISLNRCEHAYGNFVKIHKGHLCAGRLDGKGGTCVVNIKREKEKKNIYKVLLFVNFSRETNFFFTVEFSLKLCLILFFLSRETLVVHFNVV